MERPAYRGYKPRFNNLVAVSNDTRKFWEFGISLSTLPELKKNAEENSEIPELHLRTSGLIALIMTS